MMPLVGNLRDFALHDFLVLVDRGHKTGSLQLARPLPNDTTNLFFDRGRLLAVIKPYRRERLGELLIRVGKVTPQQVAHALQIQQANPGQPLGQILVAQGLIDQQELQHHIEQQIEETVYELFAWRDGEFRFLNGQRPEPDDVQSLVPLSIEGLLMEGVRRADETARIRQVLPHNDLLVRPSARQREPATTMNLTAAEWRTFACIDGHVSINDVAARTGLSAFEVGQAVYSFITAGLVEVIESPPEAQLAIPMTRRWPAANQRTHESPPTAPPKGLIDRLFSRRRHA